MICLKRDVKMTVTQLGMAKSGSDISLVATNKLPNQTKGTEPLHLAQLEASRCSDEMCGGLM